MFAIQVLVPVILAPLIFEESWSTTPLGGALLVAFILVALAGVVLLAGSKAVGAVLDEAHAKDDAPGRAYARSISGAKSRPRLRLGPISLLALRPLDDLTS